MSKWMFNSAQQTTHWKFIVMCCLLFEHSLYAQTEFNRTASASSRDSNAASLGFEKNVFTYLWNLNTAYAEKNETYSLFFKDMFSSSVIKRDNQSLRDENNLMLSYSHTLLQPLAFRAETQSFVLSDNQSLGVSNAGIHTAMAGVSYSPWQRINFTPLLGVRFDKQEQHSDKGFSYKFLSSADTLYLSDFRTAYSFRLNESALSPRQFRNNAANVFFQKYFSDDATDSIRFRWQNNRWDFYVPADDSVKKNFGVTSNIRSRSELQLGVQNVLRYIVSKNFSTLITTSIDSRKIANAIRYKNFSVLQNIPFNTSVQELRLEGAFDVRYNDESTLALLGISVGERDERHLLETIDGVDKNFQENRTQQEQRLNNTALRTTLRGTLFTHITSLDAFTANGSVNVLRYDTPDSLNTDDRDELAMNYSMRNEHTFSRFFTASFAAEVILAHTVYLFKDKSANNSWNRIFRLSPEFYYTPAVNLSSFNSFEVLANYTAFDFESLIPSVKSYSYRQFAFLDSSSYDMSPRIGVDVFFNLRLYERGELKWSEFSERPQQYVHEATFSPQIRYTFKTKAMIALGFRSFAQTRFQYLHNERVFENDYFSAGPTAVFLITLSNDSLVEFRGWKEFQRRSDIPLRELSNVTMNIRYRF